jgi:hypothetical protein
MTGEGAEIPYIPPPSPVAPGDPTYASLYAYWVKEGRPGTIERLDLDWQYRAIHPDPSTAQPTFVRIASAPPWDPMSDGPPGGYTGAMGTWQSSIPGHNRKLPQD